MSVPLPPKGFCTFEYIATGLPPHMAKIRLEGHEFGEGQHTLPGELVFGLLRDYPDNFELLAGKPIDPGKPPPGAVVRSRV